MAHWMDNIWKLKRDLFHKGSFCYFVFLIFSLLLVSNFLTPGYILTLDMVFADGAFRASSYDLFYGLSSSYSVAPFIILLGFLDILFSAEFIQKLSFVLILFISGVSAYKLCPEEWGVGRYFAGFLYMLNPFIYIRFLAGHWLLLLAYAITPFIVKSFFGLIETPKTKNIIYTALLLTMVFAVGTHTPFLLLIVLGIFLIIAIIESRKNCDKVLCLLKSAVLLGLILLILNSYWLVPSFIGRSTPLSEITSSDLYAFTTKQDLNFNTLFTVAGMYGFWRGGYIYAKDLLPYWYLFFFFILFLAVHGFISNYRDEKYGIYIKAFGVVAVLSVLLAAGISGPFASVFEFLFNSVFFFRGFREPQKFVALLVLVYAYLGGLGVSEFEKIARDKSQALGFNNYKKIGAWVIIFLALLTPIIYSFTMFNGFWGQLRPTDYPNDWYEVNNLLNQDKQDFNILFLPWHLYMDFKWIPNTQKRIANPAYIFFDKPVVQGDNMEVDSIYSSSTSPVSKYIESLLGNSDKIDNFGERMIPLNVKYVLLTKEVDYKKYFFLFNQTDLELIKETENFYIFKNSHPVSRFYLSPSDPQKQPEFISALAPVGYTQSSPVKFHVEADTGYIVFVPLNLDSEYWELDGKPSVESGFYAVYPAGEGTIYYRRFDTYLLGYFISLITLIGLIIWYRKKAVEGMLKRRRFSRRLSG